jgi:hypothetical protein
MGSTTKNALEAHYGGVIRGNFARVSPQSTLLHTSLISHCNVPGWDRGM